MPLSDEQKIKMAEGRRLATIKRKQEKEIAKLEDKKKHLDEKKKEIEAIEMQKDRLKAERKAIANRQLVKEKFNQLKQSMELNPDTNIDNINKVDEAINQITDDINNLKLQTIDNKNKPSPPPPVIEPPPQPVVEPPPQPVIQQSFQKDSKAEIVKNIQPDTIDFNNIINKITASLPNEISKKIFKNSVAKYDPTLDLNTNLSMLMQIAHNQIKENSNIITDNLEIERLKLIEEGEQLKIKQKKERQLRLIAKARRYLYQ